MRRIGENAGETFLLGVPVQLTGGYVAEWDGATEAKGIAGISAEGASNLTTDGVAKTLSFGSVPNQSAAVNIPRGAPLNDGACGFFVANDDIIFHGQVGPAQAASLSQADVGVEYGMTKDTDNHWYIDLTDTSDVVCRIIGLDEHDPRGVYFVIIQASQQLEG